MTNEHDPKTLDALARRLYDDRLVDIHLKSAKIGQIFDKLSEEIQQTWLDRAAFYLDDLIFVRQAQANGFVGALMVMPAKD
jgi:hypothetical protein